MYYNTYGGKKAEFYIQKNVLDDAIAIRGAECKNAREKIERGYFQHLITDYYFYTEFFDKDWIESVDYTEFKRVMYHDYSALNNYLIQKYGVQYPSIIGNIESIEEEPEIIKEYAIDKFIEKMSEINLKKIYDQELKKLIYK